MIIDSHQHFWSYDPAQYPWIPRDSPLQRDWLPHDLLPLLQAAGVDGCVAVQARQTLEESRWLLTLADHAPIIRAVVGWVDLRSAEVEDQLVELARHPKFRAVRHVVQDERDPSFMLGAEFQRGISKLARFGLAYDILITAEQLPAAIALARQFPEIPFVLDHLGKPPIRNATLSPWRERIRELAQSPNVFCKVSGMVTEADRGGWKPQDFRPYLDVVFAAFGFDRLMFGSDWPVCLLAASYAQVFAVVDEYLRPFDATARVKVLGGNAARFYRLG